MDFTAADYFEPRADCHRFCRIAQGVIAVGERHDPRCGSVSQLPYGERARIAAEADALLRARKH